MRVSAALLGLVFIALLAAVFLLIGMCRAAAAADRAAEAQAARGTRVWDDRAGQWVLLPPGEAPGPGQFTPEQIAELDELTVALAAPAFDPATDPQWAAGRARLLADLNDQGDLT
jgi:hypothetical protein